MSIGLKTLIFPSLLAFSVLSSANAQTTRIFDIVAHVPPAGWQNEVKPFATSWVTSNPKTGGWCRMIIYKSAESSGNALTDFHDEWKTWIAGSYPVTGQPQPQQTSGGGWTLNSGNANFIFDNRNSMATLYTFTGHSLKVSFVYLSNTDEFLPAFESFWKSIDLQEPVSTPQSTVQKEKNRDSGNPASSPTVGKIQPISHSTTNFDDGWTSTIYPNSVKVIKGQTTVVLHHGIVLNDELRQGDLPENLFNLLIPAVYQVSNFKRVYLQEGCMFLCDYYLSADVVEKSTGRQGYLAFTAVTSSGISRCIEIVTPSASAFRSEFPDPGRLSVMLYYNRFGITQADITGSWKGGSSAAMDLYYTGTGTYAGMNTAVLSDEFIFKRDGSYTSRHSGAVGMAGNMSFSDNSYSGQLKAGIWELSLSKRFEGKTDDFNAWFEAVQGGFVLHLQNKIASGIKYDLIRVP